MVQSFGASMISKASNAYGNTELPKKWIGYRHLVAFLFFFAMFSSLGTRTSLSIGMVAMVNNSTNTEHEVFDWDSSHQSTILSAFYWGYVVLQVTSGPLFQRFGVKNVLLIGLSASTIATLLTPIIASKGGWQGMCALRAVQGFSQGPLYPSSHAVMSAWIPTAERAFIGGAVFAGMQAGNMVVLATGGLLADSAGGWPSIFYVYGSVSALWCILWFFFVSSTPAENRFISEKERKYIQTAIPGQTSAEHKLKIPWLDIIKCKHVYATLAANVCQLWGQWTLTNEMPTYMSTVLGFDIKTNGALSALPYLAMTILCFIFGFIADKLIKNKLISTTLCRKLFNTVGMWLPAAALISLGYVEKGDEVLGVSLLVAAIGFSAGSCVGFQVNNMDLTPNFASAITGLTSGLSSLTGIVGPLLVGVIVTEEGSTSQWRIVFWIAGVLLFTGNLIFLLFGSAEIQPWNYPESKSLHDEEQGKTTKMSSKSTKGKFS